MLTVTRLARRCGLSRSTVLSYESIGLLRASARSPGNYREYSEDAERLRQICAYRHAGLSLADIRSVLGAASSKAAAVLERRLVELDARSKRCAITSARSSGCSATKGIRWSRRRSGWRS